MFGSRYCENGDVNSGNVVTVDLTGPAETTRIAISAAPSNGGLGRFDRGRESVLLHDQAVLRLNATRHCRDRCKAEGLAGRQVGGCRPGGKRAYGECRRPCEA